MASIANLAVILSANTAAFTEGLSSARKKLNEFGDGIKEHLESFKGLLEGVGLALGAHEIYDFIKSSAEAVDKTGKLSDRLGVSTEALVALHYAAQQAGGSTEQLDHAVSTMLKNLGGAQGLESGKKIGEALEEIGLDSSKLANMSPDKAFGKIADGFTKITNPAERAAVAVAIFGKAGAELIPLLQGGSAGIAKAAEETEKAGAAFSRIDASQVEQANEAMTRLGLITTGLGQQLAIQLSPFIEAAADKFFDLSASGTGMAEKVTKGILFIRDALAIVADEIEAVIMAFDALQAKLSHKIADAAKATAGAPAASYLDDFKTGLEVLHILPDRISSKNSTDDALKQFADGLNKDATNLDKLNAASFAALSAGDKLKLMFDQWIAKSKELAEAHAKHSQALGALTPLVSANESEIQKTISALETQLATYGMSKGAIEAYKLAQLGATQEEQSHAEAVQNSIDRLNDQKSNIEEMEKATKSLFESTRTPMEKYEAQIQKLSDELNFGSLDWDTYARAVRAANIELNGGKVPGTPAREFRFSDSVSRDLTPAHQGLVEQQLDIAKRQLDELVKLNGPTSSIATGSFDITVENMA